MYQVGVILGQSGEPLILDVEGGQEATAILAYGLGGVPGHKAEIQDSFRRPAYPASPRGKAVPEKREPQKSSAGEIRDPLDLEPDEAVPEHPGDNEAFAPTLSILYPGCPVILGIGVDVVEIKRIRRVLENQGDRFTRRIYTPAEQEYCRAHRDPVPHFAARFAAKEALLKALGTGWAGGIRWQDVEVLRTHPGPPSLVLHGEADKRNRALGSLSAHVSLSHSEDWAVAVVILER